MSDTVFIEEILRPAHQGMSQPYYCRGDDGHSYFVKGANTTRASQVYEWVCGHLAEAIGLPVAPFKLVEIDPLLLREVRSEWRHIGSGIAFGSQAIEGVAWMEVANSSSVLVDYQKDLLVFDWWIHNVDRTPFNPNLLWKEYDKQLTVIDHNLAFDAEFNPKGFLEGHLYKQHWGGISGDIATRDSYHRRLSDALVQFDAACASIPDEWNWFDQGQTVKANFDLDEVRSIITRCKTDEFWSEK